MSLTRQPSDSPPTEPPRRGRRTIALVAIAAVLLLAAVGVGIWLLRGTDEQPAAPVTATATPEVSAPPSITSPASPEDEAAAAAIARYEEYVRVRNTVGQGGYLDTQAFATVAVDPDLTLQTQIAQRNSARGYRDIGETRLASLTVQSVSLRQDPGYYPQVVLTACLDVSAVDVVDSSGQSVVPPDRPPRTVTTATLRLYQPGTSGVPPQGGWFVSETTSPGTSC